VFIEMVVGAVLRGHGDWVLGSPSLGARGSQVDQDGELGAGARRQRSSLGTGALARKLAGGGGASAEELAGGGGALDSPRRKTGQCYIALCSFRVVHA
jgi:hypothetical protein